MRKKVIHTHCKKCGNLLTDETAHKRARPFSEGREIINDGWCWACYREYNKNYSTTYKRGLAKVYLEESCVVEEEDWFHTTFPQYEDWIKNICKNSG